MNNTQNIKPCDVPFDRERLEKSINSEKVKIPEGLSKEEIIAFINNTAKN